MATVSFNPYPLLGDQHITGLTDMITSVGTGATLALIADQVSISLNTIGYSDASIYDDVEVKAIVANAGNAYLNNLIQDYSDEQVEIIDMLINSIAETPVRSIGGAIEEIEQQIVYSGLSSAEQAPLLMTTAIAFADYNYWINEVGLGAVSAWRINGYFELEQYANYANIPFWVEASVRGALTGANQASVYGMMDPPRIVGVDIASALAGSIGVVSGKVMLNWIPKKRSSYQLDKAVVAKLGSGDVSGVQNIGAGFTSVLGKTCNVLKGTQCVVKVSSMCTDDKGSDDHGCARR